MSEAISGVGTEFKRGDGASAEAFTKLAEVVAIGGPDMNRNTIDVTNLDSVGGYKEFIAGFRDAGEVTLNMNWTRDGYVAILDDFDSDDLRNYQIVFPDESATEFSFSALVTRLSTAIPADDKVSMDVTLKISGPNSVAS